MTKLSNPGIGIRIHRTIFRFKNIQLIHLLRQHSIAAIVKDRTSWLRKFVGISFHRILSCWDCGFVNWIVFQKLACRRLVRLNDRTGKSLLEAHNMCTKIIFVLVLTFRTIFVLVAVGSSGILKVNQKLGVNINFDTQDVIDFTKFSKMTMCRASEANS